jgi:hypothetical protein
MGVPGNANALLLASAAGGGAYQITRSLRFNAGDSAYLNRTPASAGNRKTWTWAGWVKRTNPGATQSFFSCYGAGSDTQNINFIFGSNDKLIADSWTGNFFTSTRVFRDPSSWMHIVIAFDSTDGTASNRLKIYQNGAQITDYTSSLTISQNTDYAVNQAAAHYIGRQGASAIEYFSGYLADIHFIDGQALDPSSFTTTDLTTGQLIPIAYSGSYGTNGFQLKFADNSSNTATTLGKDTSGNGNNWTPNNLSVTAGAGNDSLVDTPTSYGSDTGLGGEVRGNYATLNPIAGSAHTYTNGNLDLTISTSSYNSVAPAIGTIAVRSGKWYFEFVKTSGAADAQLGIVATESYPFNGGVGNTATSYAYYLNNGYKINNSTQTSYGNSVATNDIVGIALDLDNGKIWFSKNGTWQASGDPAAGTNAAFTGISSSYTYAPAVSKDTTGTNTLSGTFNFGSRSFAYTAPSGFKALCTTNLPAPLVTKPDQVFQAKTYQGTGSTQSITGLTFSPGFVWIKDRSAGNYHTLQDVVRGATKDLYSNTTDAEGTQANSLNAFNSNGFTVGTAGWVNTNNNAYISWAWDAGTTTVSNTQGSITSSVRANATAGFSVVTWTGTGPGSNTVGHGLGAAPELIIIKNRDRSIYWNVYTKTTGINSFLKLNTTDAAISSTGIWGSTAPTSTVFDGAGSDFSNGYASGEKIVAYCFAPVVGYSSFGSYTGNNSTDGPFVYTGFRPRFVLLKASSITSDWFIYDTSRNTYNAAGYYLWPNYSFAEPAYFAGMDILSNGFKMRENAAGGNEVGDYLYAAFAESPFQYARAR